jgi:hypothetical protein
MFITEAMAKAYIDAVTAALSAAGHHPLGPDGRPPAPAEADPDYPYPATICVPDPADDQLNRRCGYALLWNFDEGWVAACWTYDGRTRISMHTNLMLGVVPSPVVVAQSVAAIIADGSLQAGRVLPTPADLLAQYLTPAGATLGYPLRCAVCAHCGDTMRKDTPTSQWEDSFGNPECASAPNPDDGPMPGHEPGAPVIPKPDVPVIPNPVG